MDQEFMKEKPVMPLVISMALPMTFSMLVNALYNIIDSYFVAQISEDAMTALSLVFPLQNLVNAVVIGFAPRFSVRQTGGTLPSPSRHPPHCCRPHATSGGRWKWCCN